MFFFGDFGEQYLDLVEKYHPDVLSKAIKQLKDRGYLFVTAKWVKVNNSYH